MSRDMTLLSHALKGTHEEWGWLRTDPMKTVRRPPDPPPRERLLSDNEISRITLALGFEDGVPVRLPSQRVAIAFLFAIETAMRAGKLCGLTAETTELPC